MTPAGSIANIAVSSAIVLLVLSEWSWVQPRTSKLSFLAVVYAWYATTSIWAANTKKLEKAILAGEEHLFPSASFWLTLFPQVASCLCATTVIAFKRLLARREGKEEPSADSFGHCAWCAAGAGFYFGQLFTVDGLGAGAPGLVFGVKVLEPLSTSLLAIPVLGQRMNWRLLAAVLVACSGILVCVVGAHRGAAHAAGGSHAHGELKVIIGAVLANLGFSSRACVMKKAYSQKKISPLETFWKVNVVATACGVIMFIVWVIYGSTSHSAMAGLVRVSAELARAPWKWIATCLCYFLYQCSSILLLDCLQVETHALLVAMKHIFVVILASILSGSPLNALMIVGIVVATVGVFFYSVSPGPAEEAAKSLLPQSEKKGQQGTSIPRFLLVTLAVLGILGILSPMVYV
mmetsp:Transcript_80288/g.249210  ORF Transcript_80288/g.249210 Transcript_80288/m.249210 type:complete len:405 (-) Transcript_80288:66-1280(-)|eukprot:CAMPEP_0204600932 /NCGR_PEP_ID=MMETSP0661-20131031/55722_1 /ASSEMBLY_ACC=CAM_ASM_000606 /TAXON_ID=109239 /ORGANISM="Alexandrium margalefi, Strain AMGDE01CS-322" /LENGTH=404 /DNA_ID=CAMNT_0051611767 /DNA_START=45 /DNA_END=1259 /DNA_ORIENTATION=-